MHINARFYWFTQICTTDFLWITRQKIRIIKNSDYRGKFNIAEPYKAFGLQFRVDSLLLFGLAK